MTQPKITIAICTYNRAEYLEGSVSSSFEQDTTCSYEVLIVDNNSSDNTREVVENLQRKYPELRYVVEENVGLSHARNRALRESQAEIVAYIDDDCVLSRGWVEAVAIGFEDPKVGAAGGVTHVEYPNGNKPDWLVPSMEGLLGLNDQGPEPKQVRAVCGNNMAVRRKVALDLGGFDADLGYSGTSKLPGEDVAISRSIADAGYKVMYLPDARLVHRVDSGRLCPDWLLRRMRLNGRFYALVWYDEVTAWGASMYYVRSRILRLLALLTRDYRRVLDFSMEARFAAGELDVLLPGAIGWLKRILWVVLTTPLAGLRIVEHAVSGKPYK